jgi:hypothetical protein
VTVEHVRWRCEGGREENVRTELTLHAHARGSHTNFLNFLFLNFDNKMVQTKRLGQHEHDDRKGIQINPVGRRAPAVLFFGRSSLTSAMIQLDVDVCVCIYIYML